jgi:stage V sporulation protein D (sporulation-specific penicillin-binding protein)
LPNYDLNNPYTVTDHNLLTRIEEAAQEEKNAEFRKAQFAQWRNFTVNDTYEPGSVFKIITASAALEEKVWSMTETYIPATGALPCVTAEYPAMIRAGTARRTSHRLW